MPASHNHKYFSKILKKQAAPPLSVVKIKNQSGTALMRARQLMSGAQEFKSTNLPKHQLHYFPVEDIPNWQLQPGRDLIQWRINEVPSLSASRLLEVMGTGGLSR